MSEAAHPFYQDQEPARYYNYEDEEEREDDLRLVPESGLSSFSGYSIADILRLDCLNTMGLGDMRRKIQKHWKPIPGIPLDREIEDWCAVFRAHESATPPYNPVWASAEEQAQFDAAGLALARRIFVFFARTKELTYYPSTAGRWHFSPTAIAPQFHPSSAEDDFWREKLWL